MGRCSWDTFAGRAFLKEDGAREKVGRNEFRGGRLVALGRYNRSPRMMTLLWLQALTPTLTSRTLTCMITTSQAAGTNDRNVRIEEQEALPRASPIRWSASAHYPSSPL
jgi:hypothetical protein